MVTVTNGTLISMMLLLKVLTLMTRMMVMMMTRMMVMMMMMMTMGGGRRGRRKEEGGTRGTVSSKRGPNTTGWLGTKTAAITHRVNDAAIHSRARWLNSYNNSNKTMRQQ